jgi:flavodoxin
MRALVAYMSQTGNTKKVAQAVYDALDCEKEIMPIDQVVDIGGYDVSFLGFPMRGFGPDPKTVGLLQKHCQSGRDVALFVTHAAPENADELPGSLDKFRNAAAGANIVGMFDCQGQLAKGIKFIMSILPNRELRAMAKRDNSQGQPDAVRLERARAYAREVLASKNSQASPSY